MNRALGKILVRAISGHRCHQRHLANFTQKFEKRNFINKKRLPVSSVQIQSPCFQSHRSCSSSADRLVAPLRKLRMSPTPTPSGDGCGTVVPPHCGLVWNLSVNDVQPFSDKLIEASRKVYDSVGALKKEEITFENVLKAIADDDVEMRKHGVVSIYQNLSADKAMRDQCVETQKKLADFNVEMSMRQDVFDVLLQFEEKFASTLKPEAKRFLERMIKNGRRNGLHLPKDKQDKIKEIKKQINTLGIDFDQHLNDENTKLYFSAEELKGLPDDFIKSLEKSESGSYTVTLKYPHYFPIMKKCIIPETRRQMEEKFNSRCIDENTKILEELVELRHKKAELLGFTNHAAFILDMRMAKSPDRVQSFLSSLREKLQKLGDQEMAVLLKYKKIDCAEHGYDFDNKINLWDMRYYMNMVEEREYSLDHEKLKQYFPLEKVVKGMLEIYQELLNLKFEIIENAQVWHPDVTMYSVHDKADNNLLGYFYLDLFPREGKFGHAAVIPAQPSALLPDGKRQVAIPVMMANFTKPTPDSPGLQMHDEVETLFHEFGHVMHGICAKAEYEMFAGTSVERDFVEAPSQMLENWCWEAESLSRMSGHYSDNSPIPDDLMNTLITSRLANTGLFNLRQILLATFDQTIHTKCKSDTKADFNSLSKQILGIEPSPGTHMPASFGHLAGGYDAQYYGYLWSEVFSMDMFMSRFKKEGIMSKKAGLDYRTCILQPGGSLDGDVMLKNFLGREPSQEPFLVSKGLKV